MSPSGITGIMMTFSEDCLSLNVFTPGYNDGKKRAVMVWLHGGGWTNGNGIEHDGYHGENLARYGDIVFCSLNHRLGPMGYTTCLSEVINILHREMSVCSIWLHLNGFAII